LSKKIEEDTWVICPVCNNRLKKERLPTHMKRVHSKKVDDAEIKSLETSHKKSSYKQIQENKISKFISKKTIGIIAIIFVVIVAALSIYFLFYDQNDQKTHFVSIDGKGDFLSTQEAIDSASDNDIIFVSNGAYFENIEITKSIELIGEDKNTTIINGNGKGSVVSISADHVKIRGFTITNGGPKSASEPDAGIKIGSNHNTVSDCVIVSNKNFGLYLDANPDNIIKFNTFSNNKYGIYAFNANTNNISSNTFTSNTEYGMYLTSQSDDNTVSDNIFTENNYAIRIKGSEKNTIIKNLITNNEYGLYFCCGANSNIAYNNRFIKNTNWHALDDSKPGNTWDNGKVGNYWDDYMGKDANGDGIGDTPYLIKGDEEDRFPLMQLSN